MKAYKFNEAKGKELVDKVQEIVGQLSISDFFTLSQQLKNVATKKAEVHFSSEAYYKMFALVDGCNKEIAWDGIVYRDEEQANVFYVTDIIVYPQKVTGATVETDDEPYMNWMNTLDDETFNHRRFNGHSHVNMGVTPSGTDTTYREQSILNINDFFIYGIFNKRKEHNFQIYDVENNIIYDNADIIFYIPEPDYSDWASQEMKEKVTERVYTNPNTTPATRTPYTQNVPSAGSAGNTSGAGKSGTDDWYQRLYGGKNYYAGYDCYDN